MRIDAVTVALLDMPHQDALAFNRWYDLDHLPEHVSKNDVVTGQRYVATRPTRRAPGVVAGDLTQSHPPYATVYSFGGPLDFLDDEAVAGWHDKDRTIVKAGRYWRGGSIAFSTSWRPAEAHTRTSIQIDGDAVLHLPHRSVIFSFGRVNDADKAASWWNATQNPDLLDVPGVLAIVRMEPAGRTDTDLMLHVLLCENPAVETMELIDQVRSAQRATGRFPAYGGVYTLEAFLPYDRIVPFEYDFVGELDTEPIPAQHHS
jgi:hypothetical protein